MIDVTKMPSVFKTDGTVNWDEFSRWAVCNDPTFKDGLEACDRMQLNDMDKLRVMIMLYVRADARLISELPSFIAEYNRQKQGIK